MVDLWFDYSYYRDDFTKFVGKRFDYDEFYDLIESGYASEDFVCYRVVDEYYIIDLETGIIVNFYKHIGRCLNCNVENNYEVIMQTIQRLFEDIHLMREEV